MAHKWYFTKDGKNKVGPVSEDQLLEFIKEKQINDADYLRRDDMNSWIGLSVALDLLKTNTAPPDLNSVAANKVPAMEKLPPPLPPESPPQQPEKVGLGSLASGWLNSAKIAMAKAQEKTLEIGQKLNEKAQVAMNQAREAALKVNQSSKNSTPKQVDLKDIPSLVTRKIVPSIKTGFVLPADFAKCWNQIENAGVNVDELEFYCSTASKVEGSISNKLMNFFSTEKNETPFYSLAISKNNIFLVYSDPTGEISSVNYPFDDLVWSLSFKTSTENSSWFPGASKNTSADPCFLLNLKKPDQNHEIKLLDCPDVKVISTIISNKMLDSAKQYFISGEYDSCEKYIEKIPETSEAYNDARDLMKKIGLVAKGEVLLQSGHQGYDSPVRGILRYDFRGLSFCPSVDADPFVYPPSKLRKIFEPKIGKFPPEYVEEIKSKKNSALAAVKLAKLGLKTPNSTARMLAKTTLSMAVSHLNSIKIGDPFVNRVSIVTFSEGEHHRLVFDFSGFVKSEVDALTADFFEAISRITDSWGKKSPAAQDSSLDELNASLMKIPKIVGCPKCKAKIRASRIGVVGCPRCKIKVRVK